MYLEPHQVVARLSIAKRLVVRAEHLMGSGITTAKGRDVGHRNIELVELGGMHPAYAPPIGGGYIKVVFMVSICVFYK